MAMATSSFASAALIPSYSALSCCSSAFAWPICCSAAFFARTNSSARCAELSLRLTKSLNVASSLVIVAIFSLSCCSSSEIFSSSVLIFSNSTFRRWSSPSSLAEVETELSICICLKSRSERISLNLSSDMPPVFSDCAILREIACSKPTTFSCVASNFFTSIAFFSSNVSMSSDISLSLANSSWKRWVFGSFASLISLDSCESCARPRRIASWCSATTRSASAMSKLSAFTFCKSISRCCDSES
mmetsp:Transcript_7982/g.19701  ORF Transcript_7982/g.19701 Transcript_7982/m.19701 type:complete len:245 (-) Transcript_7982:18-752(-)